MRIYDDGEKEELQRKNEKKMENRLKDDWTKQKLERRNKGLPEQTFEEYEEIKEEQEKLKKEAEEESRREIRLHQHKSSEGFSAKKSVNKEEENDDDDDEDDDQGFDQDIRNEVMAQRLVTSTMS